MNIYSILGNACNDAYIKNKLEELQNWSGKWQLDISYKKCNAVLTSKQQERKTEFSVNIMR